MKGPGGNGAPPATPHALWGGRFRGGMAPDMAALNLSLDVDRRTWREDVRASRAWARALEGAGVLSAPEAAALDDGLQRVAARLDAGGAFADAPDEDVHALVERLLFEEAGDVAGKLHTGRSRNDQAATGTRMWGMAAARRLDDHLGSLMAALHGLAARSVDVILPGYTHLQRAQPIRGAHWALAHLWPLARDRVRIGAAEDAAATLPLGSGALAGCPFPVDREALGRELGFLRVSPNSVDAVSDRDWMLDLLYAGATVGVHLSRLGEDLVLFTSAEFGFLALGEGYATGSSLMPQKRNPDVAELARGKAGRLVGNLAAVLTLLKGLPTGYNRDLQEDKRSLFDTVDALELTLPAVAGAVATAAWRPGPVARALDPQLLATDLADVLVRRGVPFRKAHAVVGGLVLRAEAEGTTLDRLPDAVLRKAHPAFAGGAGEALDPERSVEARDATGGTSRRAVLEQLEAARALL